MVLTKEELIASLQNEVRILLHLASKIDPAKVDYRPSAKQRSILELLQYLSYMGPALLPAIKNGSFDLAAWSAAENTAKQLNLDQLVTQIGTQPALYAEALGAYGDTDFRAEVEMFGQKSSRGALLVNVVLSGFAAYRTQLFLYLKACGREELNTFNLWAGMDGQMATA